MFAHSTDSFLSPRDPPVVGTDGSLDLAPARDGDALVTTFTLFVGRVARCTRFDLTYADAAVPEVSAVLHVRLDPDATVAQMRPVVSAAVARARAALDEQHPGARLPVGIARVARLEQTVRTARLLTLVLSRAGEARWRYDPDAFSREHIRALAARFAQFRTARSNRRWSAVPTAELRLRST